MEPSSNNSLPRVATLIPVMSQHATNRYSALQTAGLQTCIHILIYFCFIIIYYIYYDDDDGYEDYCYCACCCFFFFVVLLFHFRRIVNIEEKIL